MKIVAAIIFLIFTFSCTTKENGNRYSGNSIDIIAKPKKIATDNNVTTTQSRDTITMVTEKGKGIYSAEGIIDSIHPRIYITFTTKTPGNLYAVVKPLMGEGNLRINQIFYPDKTADGPFGKDIAVKLNQVGEHTLVVGHSQMAEDPYQGKFRVDLQME